MSSLNNPSTLRDTAVMEAPSEASIIPNTYPTVILGTPVSSSPSPPSENPLFEISSPTLPTNQLANPEIRIEDFNLFSDPFITQSPISNTYIFNQNKKRGSTIPLSNQNKQPRIQNNPTTPKEAILKARDLILLASTLTQSHDEQSKLLDLLEIFREYTEKGKLTTASNIITSQITHLDSATRKIETQAKALTKAPLPINTPTTKSTYAAITKEGEWNLVGKGKTSRPTPIDKKIEITQRRLILIKPEIKNITSFSPISIRNQINEASQKTGIKGPVIAAVTLSLNSNIIITTNAPFTSQLLLEKKTIWSNLIKFERIQKDQEWHKVIIHKIPIKEFSGTRGMDLILEEIKTFNPEFKPIGTPFWLTPSSKRAHQQEGAIVIAFATKSEAELAIRKRLYIAGISTRVEKFYESKPTTQCQKCQGFGHQDTHCKRNPSCGLYGGKHITAIHLCIVCNIRGKLCSRLITKCSNCQGNHTASSKSCEIFKSIQQKSYNINQ